MDNTSKLPGSLQFPNKEDSSESSAKSHLSTTSELQHQAELAPGNLVLCKPQVTQRLRIPSGIFGIASIQIEH